MVTNQIFIFARYIIDNNGVCHVMKQTHPENPDDQLEKVLIILFTNAVIQVSTVMIKT